MLKFLRDSMEYDMACANSIYGCVFLHLGQYIYIWNKHGATNDCVQYTVQYINIYMHL